MTCFLKGIIFFFAVVLITVGAVFYFLPLHQKVEKHSISPAQSSVLQRQSCEVETRWGSDFQLRCYTFYPNFPKTHIALPVHVYDQEDSLALPLLYLPGGPGEMLTTGQSMHELVESWLASSGLNRDLVLLDFRGNLPGVPYEACPGYLDALKDLFRKASDRKEEAAILEPKIKTCLARFAHRLGSDLPPSEALAQLNTHQNAKDTKAVMQALGYSAWHLAGVSYGTRVALQAAATQTEVQKLILDSVYVPSDGGTLTDLTNEVGAFKRFFDYCDQVDRCVHQKKESNGEGSTEALFWQVLKKLDHTPLRVRSENWETDLSESWMLTGDRLLGVMYYNFYTAASLRALPTLLDGINNNADVEGFVVESEWFDGFYNAMLDPQFNDLVFYATECHDNSTDNPNTVAELKEILGLLGKRFSIGLVNDFCSELGLGVEPLRLSSAILLNPTLMIGGALDPVTPIDSAYKFSNRHQNTSFVSLPDRAHAEFFWDICGARAIEPFLVSERSEAVSVRARRNLEISTCMARNYE